MLNYLYHLSNFEQTLLASLFTWGITAFGASFVLLNIKPSQKLLDIMLSFAGGVMMAASFWSLLQPSIEMSDFMGKIKFIPPTIGLVGGALFLRILDKIIPHLHIDFPETKIEGIKTKLNKTLLLVFAVTLHNIPEGLAIGVAFGSTSVSYKESSLIGALVLSLGIGIQNFPEGFAVSMPLRSQGLSKIKSFFLGQLSGFVEPISAIIGFFAVSFFHSILPYAMAFAAGAMIYVVVEEAIPESQIHGNTDIATISFIVGFIIMMILDVSLS